jgi:hypothetical protein
VVVVALGESNAQACREGNERRGRCGGGRQGSSPFIGVEGAVVKVEEWPVFNGDETAHS